MAKIWWLCIVTCCATLNRGQFHECHDDPTFEPDEGALQYLQFTWLGALQYIHIKGGTPHYSRVPRVVLIHRQFALSTAVDAAQVPTGYALGNVVFGDYERDEAECGITHQQLAEGADCDPAVLLMPIADVLLHPDYKNFGTKNSVALLKFITTIKSRYMVPVCLPFRDFISRSDGTPTSEPLFHIDFFTAVPRDFVEEEKEVTRITILPRELCYLYDFTILDTSIKNTTNYTSDREVCTSGCGLRSGAPTVFHEHTGHWSLVTLAQGGSACPDPLIPRRPPSPPSHVVIHPYVPWITRAITGTPVGDFTKDDPFGYSMLRASPRLDRTRYGWIGHWWMGGIRCYDRGAWSDDLFRFYHEVFQINPHGVFNLTYYLQIDAAHRAIIVCVKIGVPYIIGQPRVWELDTASVKVRIPLVRFRQSYKFEVEAWAHNETDDQAVGDDDGEDDQ